jgi:hypothetical protein
MNSFFCGFGPRDPETGILLVLQKLMVPLDLALVQVAGDFARDLLLSGLSDAPGGCCNGCFGENHFHASLACNACSAS